MSGVYNSFEIKFRKSKAEAFLDLVKSIINKTDYRYSGLLVWEELEASGNNISAETYEGFDFDDCEQSRNLFLEICKEVAIKAPDEEFMAHHCFDYSAVDARSHYYAFYRDKVLDCYQVSVDGDAGWMTDIKEMVLEHKGTVFELVKEREYDSESFGDDDEWDDSDKEDDAGEDDTETEQDSFTISSVMDAYDQGQYPVINVENNAKEEPAKPNRKIIPPEEEGVEKLGKYKAIAGRFYCVEYDNYGKTKSITGKLQDYFPKTYVFELLGDDFNTEYIEARDIKKMTEVYETEETLRIRKEYEQTNLEIKEAEEKQKELGEQFYSLYVSKGASWRKQPLEQIDIGKSYKGVAGIEIGKSYLIKVKEKQYSDTDVVLTVRESEDAIGKMVFVLSCYPNPVGYGPHMIRPVVAWNLNEFTDELVLDEEGLGIQRQRIDLYNKVNDLYGKKKQLKNEYPDSFME